MNKKEAEDFVFDNMSVADIIDSGVLSLINSIYDDTETRTCINCKWFKENVCVNGDSHLCAYFVDKDFWCIKFERV